MIRSDEKIKKDIVDELYWDMRIDASQIAVTVENGVATISGDVPTYGDLSAARDATGRIAGVTDVIDDLTVNHLSSPPLPSDEEIKTRAENILAWDTVIDGTEITVTVLNGLVTLEGTVNAHWKRPFVENKVAGVRGILSVVNKLAVVPTEKISDEIIAEDIVSAIDRDSRVNAQDIEVEVDNGIVTLTGSVPRWQARWAAEDDASLTAGVIDVINKVKLAA